MTEIKGASKYIRTSARKLRLVVPLVNGLPPEKAIAILEHSAKRAAIPLIKTIKQVTANAVNNLKLKEESLTIKNVVIEEGPTYKRWRAAARGRARQILKRTSHIKVTLEAKEEKKGDKKNGTKS